MVCNQQAFVCAQMVLMLRSELCDLLAGTVEEVAKASVF